MSTKLDIAFTAAQVRVCNTKACFRCMKMRRAEGGELIPDSRGRLRWACARCAANHRAREATDGR